MMRSSSFFSTWVCVLRNSNHQARFASAPFSFSLFSYLNKLDLALLLLTPLIFLLLITLAV